jgi:hypothetical protein
MQCKWMERNTGECYMEAERIRNGMTRHALTSQFRMRAVCYDGASSLWRKERQMRSEHKGFHTHGTACGQHMMANDAKSTYLQVAPDSKGNTDYTKSVNPGTHFIKFTTMLRAVMRHIMRVTEGPVQPEWKLFKVQLLRLCLEDSSRAVEKVCTPPNSSTWLAGVWYL